MRPANTIPITIVFGPENCYVYREAAQALFGGSMGVTKVAATENRQKILDAAARLFREKGVDAVGLSELMKEAGFTQGGFYNHFKSKEVLVEEVLKHSVEQGVQDLSDAIARSHAEGVDPLSRQVNWYLSPEQRDDIECGCAMAGFAGDVRRLAPAAQLHYATALRKTFHHVADMIKVQQPELTHQAVQAKAMALYSQMIGGLLLSRAVGYADPKFSDEILKHTRADLLRAPSLSSSAHKSKAPKGS